MIATCSGCGIKSNKLSEYTKEDPVENDGTYANGKFVCTSCYIELIDFGQDIGPPIQLQSRAQRLIHKAIAPE